MEYAALAFGIVVFLGFYARDCFVHARNFATNGEVGWAWFARVMGVVVILVAIALVAKIGFYYLDVVRPFEEFRHRPCAPVQGLRSSGAPTFFTSEFFLLY